MNRLIFSMLFALLVGVFSLDVSAENEDTDGDGWTDYHEESCRTDPLNAGDTPQDTDSSGICDYLDPDDDNDGWLDRSEEICGSDPLLAESFPDDTDGDGVCDTLGLDTDQDGWIDYYEILCESSPTENQSIPLDIDGDGRCEILPISLPVIQDPIQFNLDPQPVTVQIAIISTATIITVGSVYAIEPYRWSVSRKLWLSTLLLFGLVRQTKDGEFQRGRLYGFIESNPGIHLSALTRLSNLGNNQATYHLDRLEKEGRIWSRREGRLLIFFTDTVPLENSFSSPILDINFSKNSIKRSILLHLNQSELMQLSAKNGSQIAKEIGISPQVFSYHIRSLINWNMVKKKRLGLKVSLSITDTGIEALTNMDLN